jgi:hypothetical protein
MRHSILSEVIVLTLVSTLSLAVALPGGRYTPQMVIAEQEVPCESVDEYTVSVFSSVENSRISGR